MSDSTPDPIPAARARTAPVLDGVPELLVRVRDGDARAFEQLFGAFYERLCSFAVEHGVDGDAASDIVQDVMVTFWQRRNEWSITTASALTGYLFQAVRHLVARQHRDRAIHERSARAGAQRGASLGRGESPVGPEEQTTFNALRADLDAAISTMPQDRRIAVSLRVHDGLSYDEIAEILGVGAPAIRMHLSRARASLVAVFDKHRT